MKRKMLELNSIIRKVGFHQVNLLKNEINIRLFHVLSGTLHLGDHTKIDRRFPYTLEIDGGHRVVRYGENPA